MSELFREVDALHYPRGPLSTPFPAGFVVWPFGASTWIWGGRVFHSNPPPRPSSQPPGTQQGYWRFPHPSHEAEGARGDTELALLLAWAAASCIARGLLGARSTLLPSTLCWPKGSFLCCLPPNNSRRAGLICVFMTASAQLCSLLLLQPCRQPCSDRCQAMRARVSVHALPLSDTACVVFAMSG